MGRYEWDQRPPMNDNDITVKNKILALQEEKSASKEDKIEDIKVEYKNIVENKMNSEGNKKNQED